MATSAQWLRTTIEIASRIGWGDAMWRGLSGVMGVAQHVGRNVDAARIYGGVHAFEDLYRRRQHADVMVGYDAIVGRIAKSLGDRFETERDVGAAAGWEATIGLALSVATQIADRPATRPPRRRGPRANTELTERELDVLAQLVAGQTNHQIGDQLRISPKTVMHHTMSVYRKLGVRGRAEAVAHAVRAGLVDT